MLLIDSHCHLDQLNYNIVHKNIDDVLNKSYKNNIKKFLTVSTSLKNFYTIQKAFDQYPSIFYSCGVHPLYCHKECDQIKKIEKLSKHEKVIALGETGLDYLHSEQHKNTQKYFFREHIQTAIILKKPIIVHSRNASEDTLKILQEYKNQGSFGVLHSFTENYQTAFKLLDMGFYISFSGIITFKNAIVLKETIKKIPLDRLLIETDSPYLAPVPYRGKENQPAYLLDIAKNVAMLKKIDLEHLAYITTKNFYTLFNI